MPIFGECSVRIRVRERVFGSVSGHHNFNQLQALQLTITFQNVPTARRSRSTLTAKSGPKDAILVSIWPQFYRNCTENSRKPRLPWYFTVPIPPGADGLSLAYIGTDSSMAQRNGHEDRSCRQSMSHWLINTTSLEAVAVGNWPQNAQSPDFAN